MPDANTGGAPRVDALRIKRFTYSVLVATGLTGSLTLSLPAVAGENTVVPESVLITARPPDPVGNQAFSTTLLDAQQLRVAPNLDEALRQVPGLSLFRRNSSLSANPTVQGVSLRSIAGSGAGRALVTLDGVPQNDPFGGWVIWSSLPSEDIQGAEVVRGAGAGPYGAGALTGVIALFEREGTGLIADADGGELHSARAAEAAGAQLGKVSFGISGMYQTSGGWIPVSPDQRGAADTPVTLKATSASIHAGMEIVPGTLVTGRLGFYNEKRNSGIGDTASHAQGTTGSITVAHPESEDTLGWRAQAWFRDTDLSNSTAAIAAGRVSTTPASNQYAVPALGWGGNAALRGAFSWLDWEVGADARLNDGESHEQFGFFSGAFHSSRFAGGRTSVGGVYAEGATRFDGWLLTGGVRLDEWANSHGHIIERSLSTGAITLDNESPDTSGTVPTARAGVRKDLGDGLYLRSAAYEGFRAPSLNELYRGFRVGNNITEANGALKPERLYGVEVGVGDDQGALTWDLTGFWNKLSDGVSLVTIGGPGTYPGVGTVPAGGLLIQRQNVGYIGSFGAEGETKWQLEDMLALRGAFSVTDARVHGGPIAPQLTGKRPAQTPRMTLTGGVVVTPFERLTLEGDVRYETLRFSDDTNTLPLAAATTIDARATYQLTDMIAVYLAADNLFDANIATSEGADGVFTYDAPRIIRAGIALRIGPKN